MAFQLQSMRFQTADPRGPAGPISFFAGDDQDPEKSSEWISGLVISELPSGKSLALHQIRALLRARDLIDGEIDRLKPLYEQSQQAL